MSVAGIIIGRNEGERLVRCLHAAREVLSPLVYVDSGSTDDSVAAARAAGAHVVLLDDSLPFTAARGRNAGLAALEGDTVPEFVQFLDGDCELQPGWVEAATGFLRDHPDVVVVCGRRRERFPEGSVYNRLTDDEWNTPIGEALACGGDAMFRMAPLRAVGGFDVTLIAGEEPELCQRLRRKGGRIWRLDHEMTLHDAAMTRFGQWWARMRRGGHAAAEGAFMHGAGPDRHGVAQMRRALLWGLVLPVVALVLALLVSPWALLLLLIYPAQIARLARRRGGGRAGWDWALFNTLGKFAEAAGVLRFYRNRLMRRRSGLIEYK